MAWMIKAGKMGKGAAGSASTLSIVSVPNGAHGWRLLSVHACHAAPGDVWQDVLENLIQQENNDEQ
ncbi:hypothetical protein [Massilia sp. S19_KUP03_FR1]|uniref:hypothetical protein n=1 Tax=Massilia sp. S19_KUP03_FR1 TaxID=3025503 RepID=UPI002FCDABB2